MSSETILWIVFLSTWIIGGLFAIQHHIFMQRVIARIGVKKSVQYMTYVYIFFAWPFQHIYYAIRHEYIKRLARKVAKEVIDKAKVEGVIPDTLKPLSCPHVLTVDNSSAPKQNAPSTRTKQ